MKTNSVNKLKFIKDNVHGYVYIEDPFFSIIDTAIFQRLKNVKQTSYISLYPGSTHDRFTHSIGTFYLGSMAINSLNKNISEKDNKILEDKTLYNYSMTFKLACLLHDVGHSPFSHTGEHFFYYKKYDEACGSAEFYKKVENERSIELREIDVSLINAVAKAYDIDLSKNFDKIKSHNKKKFEDFIFDFSKVIKCKSAKPHEIMSATISLQYLQSQISKIAKEFTFEFDADLFVRCIIGATYFTDLKKKDDKDKKSVKNAIISLLNSSIIDVDKLDYILRDKYMTGYKNIDIDVERLLKSFTLLYKDDEYKLGYKKAAFSVIENVILANDSLKRWVQSHPVILYDIFLTQKSLVEALELFKKYEENSDKIFEKFFCVETLTENGNKVFGNEVMFLAGDVEAITLIKKAYVLSKEKNEKEAENLFSQFLSRENRRHSFWKSELEFNVCFDEKFIKENDTLKERFDYILQSVNAFIAYRDEKNATGNVVINDKLIACCDNGETKYTLPVIKFLKVLQKYFKNIKKEFDLVILNCDAFNSGLKKLKKNKVYIEMPKYAPESWKCDNIYSYEHLSTINENEKNISSKLFYFYSSAVIDTRDFITYLLEKAELQY